MANSKWIQFIRTFAKANNMTFGCALSDPECSRQYRQQNNIQKNRKTVKNKSNIYDEHAFDLERLSSKSSRKSLRKSSKSSIESLYNYLARIKTNSPPKSQSNTKTKTQRQRIKEIANNLNIDINVNEIPDSELKNVRNRLGKIMVNPKHNPYIKK
jgi:small-conductance mechanosensitive channel